MRRPSLLAASIPFVLLALAASVSAAEKPPLSSGGKVADEAGFVGLFNGENLDGWQGATRAFAVEKGLLVSQRRGSGFMHTKKQYGDFIFRFEYRLTPAANNGVGIRAPAGSRASLEGMEIQILDDTAKKWADLEPAQYNGSIYGVVPCKRGHLKPLGKWNAMEIRALGQKIRVTLNGTVVTEADMSKVGPTKIHRREAKGLHNLKGCVGLCAHGSRVEFRNVRIKEL
jgi:hypothetical protein